MAWAALAAERRGRVSRVPTLSKGCCHDRHDDAPRPWLVALVARRPVNVAATALAHKTARAVWAMLTRQEAWRAPTAAATA